ncbi:hypothetical protein GCM10010149_88540 [Nonomuraea roseoviolacea subsp. roseoviolacea]|uniref:hypothetical protein n=1 Tax=Nonomuraea roseoviolacea TaxID=103837 RepID=UPI0031E2DD90
MKDQNSDNARAAEIAALLLRSAEIGEKYYRTIIPGIGKVFDSAVQSALVQHDSSGKPVKEIKAYSFSGGTAAQREDLAFYIGDSIATALWKQGRVVYQIDPDTWNAIGEADTTMTVPVELLARLPHPNPLIVFPEPILIQHPDEEFRQKVSAVYVSGVLETHIAGKKAVQALCSTHDPGVKGWTLQFVGFVEDRDGKPIIADDGFDPPMQDLMRTRTSIMLDQPRSLSEMIEKAAERFIYGHDAFGKPDVDLPLLLRRAVNLLVYLCSENSDLRPVEAKRKQSRKQRRTKPQPTQIVEVGYRVGQQLRAWKKYERDHENVPGTGKKKAPHIRRAHAHTYRVGKGRQDTIIKWLWPIQINMTAGDETTTVVPVKGTRRK